MEARSRGASSWICPSTWASVIVNGRSVATDYAPDTGWLVATRDAKRGGIYLLEDPVPLSMTVPAGWTVEGRGLRRDAEDAHVEFLIGDTPEDPCPDTIEPPLGPSFDDLVTYLAGLPSIDISESTDVTVDGYRGKYLEFTRFDGAVECEQQRNRRDAGEFDGPIPIDLLYNDVWILDVDGVRLDRCALGRSTHGDCRVRGPADRRVDPHRTLTRHRSAVPSQIEHAGVTMNRFTVVADSAARLPLVAAIVMSIASGCGSSGRERPRTRRPAHLRPRP